MELLLLCTVNNLDDFLDCMLYGVRRVSHVVDDHI